MKNKQAQMQAKEVINIIGAIIALVFLIPLVSLLFDPSVFTSSDKFINNFMAFFIPLFVLVMVIEFIRRIIE
jgi:hypothetical protein